MSLVKDSGWRPAPHYLRDGDGEGERTKQFTVKITNTYSGAEMDEFRFFTVEQWGEHWVVGTSGEGMRDGCMVGRAAGVGDESGEGWDQKIGYVAYGNCFVHPSIRKAFTEAGLQGLGYRPLLWSDPENAKGEYWQLFPDVRMPLCLTPVLDHEDRLCFDDGPFNPVELRYRSAEVAALGEFDAAFALEETPVFKSLEGKHKLIVSQRFRQVCKHLGLVVDYSPVRLDAPPPELPWFFHSDTPPV